MEGEDGWQVEWTPATLAPDLVEGDTLGLRTLTPDRGDITGADGAVLVTERPVLRYGLDKTKVEGAQVARSARRIARILDIDAASYVERAEAMGAEAFVEAVVLREEDAREVLPAFRKVPGALAVNDTLPLAPSREFAAALLGRVGAATEEVVEDVRRRDRRRRRGRAVRPPGALRRAAARHDRQGRRRPRRRTTSSARSSRSPPSTARTSRRRSPRRCRRRPRPRWPRSATARPASALVAIRPSDGAVLATANGAGAEGADLADTGQYAPGSTFKVVSSLALLRSGLAPGDRVACPATTIVDGRSFKNYDDYPAVVRR